MSNTRNEKGYIATEPTQDGRIGWCPWLSVRWLDGTTDSAWDDWMAPLTQREMIGWRHWLSMRWLDGITDSAWDDWMASLTQREMIGWHHWLSRHEAGQTPGDGIGRGSVVCCSPGGSQRVWCDLANEQINRTGREWYKTCSSNEVYNLGKMETILENH